MDKSSGCVGPNLDKVEFTLYDLADEEVHYSRIPPDQYFHYDNCNNDYKKLPLQPQTLDTNFTNVTLANGASTTSYLANNEINSDQVTSSRLLNSIGSRLRRGSNYLIAPKLVGQYLLGITIQSWSDFLNTSKMMKAPTNRHQLTRRLFANLTHFQGNYLCVSLILIIYCILTSPLLLLAIAGYVLALYLVTARSALGKQMKLIGYRFNLQQQYSFITMISLPLLWVAGAPSAMFWVIGASFFIVGAHASMYESPNELVSTVVPLQYNQIGKHSQEAHITSVQYYNHYQNNAKMNTKELVVNTINSCQGTTRTPDVQIISHDYAGLGRVYEI